MGQPVCDAQTEKVKHVGHKTTRSPALDRRVELGGVKQSHTPTLSRRKADLERLLRRESDRGHAAHALLIVCELCVENKNREERTIRLTGASAPLMESMSNDTNTSSPRESITCWNWAATLFPSLFSRSIGNQVRLRLHV